MIELIPNRVYVSKVDSVEVMTKLHITDNVVARPGESKFPFGFGKYRETHWRIFGEDISESEAMQRGYVIDGDELYKPVYILRVRSFDMKYDLSFKTSEEAKSKLNEILNAN